MTQTQTPPSAVAAAMAARMDAYAVAQAARNDARRLADAEFVRSLRAELEANPTKTMGQLASEAGMTRQNLHDLFRKHPAPSAAA